MLLVILGLAAFVYMIVSGGAPLTVSQETTVIVEPLKSNGQTVDFHQAIQAMIEPDVPADENGFRAVVLGYGRETFVAGERHQANEEDWQYAEMCKALAIDPETPATFSLPRPMQNDQQWLAEVGEGLDAVQVAASKPHYFVPMIRQSEKDFVVMSQPSAVYGFHERLSEALRHRANTRFQSNEVGEAWKDVLTSLRLFRHVTINQVLERKDEESPLAPVAEVVATLSEWTPAQLEQAMRDLETLPDWQDRQTTLTMIQFVLLDLLSATNDPVDLQVRFQKMLPEEMLGMLPVIAIAFDWNLVAKELNNEIKTYSTLLEEAAGKSLDEQFDQLSLRLPGETLSEPVNEENLEEFLRNHIEAEKSLDVLFTSGRSKLSGTMVGRYVVTWLAGEIYRQQLIEESRCQALRWALALERYHREHQTYPDTLEPLGLQPMPQDMGFHYEKVDTGYRLQNKVFRLDKE